jgi:hypothetical protein
MPPQVFQEESTRVPGAPFIALFAMSGGLLSPKSRYSAGCPLKRIWPRA